MKGLSSIMKGWTRFRGVLLCVSLLLGGNRVALADDDAQRFFETAVRPLLIEHCTPCHGDEQSAGLRVDSLEGLLQGGDSGPALVPGDAASSLIIQAVRHRGGLEMPPEEVLAPQQINALVAWVNSGAYWPKPARSERTAADDAGENHWAFRPVQEPPIPTTGRPLWARTAVDSFVLAKLEESGLIPSPEADRRTLIRRASYALTGLPPSAEETREFIEDPDPHAYEHLIERLLDSPRYGEHWARHWLDVARYSDTKGYVYAREERFWVHAWSYRDWVVNALNDDLPYDRFLLLQIAADQVEDRAAGDLAAMGFLTLGRRFLGVKHDIIDDRIDVVTRGTMGLTVGCARCHNHKYDPIPTADYYSLYGVFDSSSERLVPLSPLAERDASAEGAEFFRELDARQEKLAARMAESRAMFSDLARQRIAAYLHAQTELDKYPTDSFGQILQKDDLLPAVVRRWERYLRGTKQRGDPVFVHWHAYRDLPAAGFAQEAVKVTERLQGLAKSTANSLVRDRFAVPPKTFGEVVERYSALFLEINTRWETLQKRAASEGPTSEGPTSAGPVPPLELPDADAEQIRRVLYGAGSPCEVPDEPIVHTEDLFDSATRTELWKLQGGVDRWIIDSKIDAPHALTLVDRPFPVQPQIFRRGNPANKGAEIPRQFLQVLAGEPRKPFQRGSGRFELAAAIASPTNPLTARVLVNRVWTHHFGQGLVSTPSDFGTRAEKPSHPELLDYLAARFVEEGWSLKKLHRWILLSSTFRQISTGASDPQVLAAAESQDPQNRLLWRMNPRRLRFEEFRDSLLMASGTIDLEVGGRPVPLFEQPFPVRRTLYGLVDRQFLPTSLRVFDFANPDLHIPQRSETTVPQQALFFMNHPFVIQQAKALAARAGQAENEPAAVRHLFQRVLQRDPSPREAREALGWVRAVATDTGSDPLITAKDWQYGYGQWDAENERVATFSPLPHFTGTAWQGGEKWPDAKLGWVQLTAEGGHPGNDRQHASVRRWTAPERMSVTIRSELNHEAAPGDGIRAFVVSSKSGLLETANIHQQTIELKVESLVVEAGETIDFLVDIGDVLNSDQYVWKVQLEEQEAGKEGLLWDSGVDFMAVNAERLKPWEQLAQILLCTNELFFVD